MGQDYNEILLEATEVVAKTVAADLVSSLEQELTSEPVELEPFIIDPTARILPIEIFNTQDSSVLITNSEESKSYTWLLNKAASYDRLTLSMAITVGTSAATVQEADEDKYGVKITVWGSEKAITLDFTSKEMLGNAKIFYNALQKCSFDISEVINIYKINIAFYKTGYTSSTITFNNIQALIGYDANTYGTQMGESLTLRGATEDLQYHSRIDGFVYDGNSHALSLTWVYQDEEGVYQVINKNNADRLPADTTVFWYRYQQNVRGDGYGGKNWVRIENIPNLFNYTANNFNGNLEQEQYKVVLLRHNLIDNTMVATESNVVTIQNIKDEKTIIFKNPSLQFKDGTNGIYSFYDFDDIVHSNYLSETTRTREIGIVYTSNFTWNAISLQIDKIVWRVPLDNVAVSANIEEKFSSADELYNYYEVFKYQEAQAVEEVDLAEPVLYYTIAAQRQQTAANTIACIITMRNGDEYIFEKGINFTTINLNRLNYNVIVHLQDARGNVRSAIKVGETLTLQVQVYDANGAAITTTSGVFSKKEEKYVNSIITGNQIELTSITAGQLPYLVLKYTYTIDSPVDVGTSSTDAEGNTITETRSITLEQLIPIPISTYSDNILYQGPDTVIYSSSGGSPIYNMQEIKALDLSGNKISTGIELKRYAENQFQAISSKAKGEIYPKVASNNRLVCPQVFDQAIKEELLLLILKIETMINDETKTGYYYQPIIMTQDVYFSSIINNWDGSLTIDEEGNYILASAYVAGSKNDTNKFTGVVMGDLNTINPNATGENDKNIPMSGLFGYHEGIQSFGFKTDGTAFLGKSGAGQIKFNGNGGLIQSGNYDRGIDDLGVGGIYTGKTQTSYTLTLELIPNLNNKYQSGICKFDIRWGGTVSVPYTDAQYIINNNQQYELRYFADDENYFAYLEIDGEDQIKFISLTNISGNPPGPNIAVNNNEEINLKRTSDSKYASSGTLIDLISGEIYSKNFRLTMNGDVSMRGTIEAEAGKLANFFISKAHLGNAEKLVDSTFGLANPTIANKGDEINEIYGRKEFDDNKQPTGTSRITIFAGAAPSTNKENAATNAEINTKGSSTNEPKNGIPYYVTKDGFLKANNIYSRGSIVNETNNYITALYEGQVNIHNNDTEMQYAIQSIVFKDKFVDSSTNKEEIQTAQIKFSSASGGPYIQVMPSAEFRAGTINAATLTISNIQAPDDETLKLTGTITADAITAVTLKTYVTTIDGDKEVDVGERLASLQQQINALKSN